MKYNSKSFLYFGLFLTESDKNILRPLLDKEYLDYINAKMYLDHTTLLFKSDVNTEKGKDIIKFMSSTKEGFSCTLKVDAIAYSDKCAAFRIIKNDILNKYCMNATPHITIATFNGGKPVDSNKITEWKELKTPIIIHPIYKVVNKY